MHLCKGNGTQSWIADGGYEALAERVFARAMGFDTFLVEYDGERSGSFEPLASLPDDKRVVLGLVSTKWAEIENSDLLAGRIEEAAGYHPKEQLGVSTQCGSPRQARRQKERR